MCKSVNFFLAIVAAFRAIAAAWFQANPGREASSELTYVAQLIVYK